MTLTKTKYQLIIDEKRAFMQNHPEFLKLGVSITQFSDYDVIEFENFLKSKKRTSKEGFYEPIFKTKPFCHMVLRPTRKLKYFDFKQNLTKKHELLNTNINWEEIEKIEINAFTTSHPHQIPILKKYFTIFEKFSPKPSFYLQGSFNTGKTFFLKLIMKYFLSQQIPFLFLFMPDLSRQFKLNWLDQAMQAKMDCLQTTPYLFLDDLGAETMSPYLRDDILFPILHYRQQNKLSVFISSNFDWLMLKEHLATSTASIHQFKAMKIIHKLQQMCQFFPFDRNSLNSMKMFNV